MTKQVDINPLLNEIIRETKKSQDEIASDLGYDRSYLSQARNAGTRKLYKALESYLMEFRKSNFSNVDLNAKVIALLEQQVKLLQEQNEDKARIINEKDELISNLQDKINSGFQEVNKVVVLHRAYLKTVLSVLERMIVFQEKEPVPKVQEYIDTLLTEYSMGLS